MRDSARSIDAVFAGDAGGFLKFMIGVAVAMIGGSFLAAGIGLGVRLADTGRPPAPPRPWVCPECHRMMPPEDRP